MTTLGPIEWKLVMTYLVYITSAFDWVSMGLDHDVGGRGILNRNKHTGARESLSIPWKAPETVVNARFCLKTRQIIKHGLALHM